MWKAVIADDERIIVKGLKRLIDWEALDIEIVGEAYDGEQLKKVIECFDPDIILSDINMPYLTGLEVIQWYTENHSRAQFIFVSGYQEFSYARDAITYGAVDYLLKPVAAADLEAAVRKALSALKVQTTVEIFSNSKDQLQIAFENINNGKHYEQDELHELFQKAELDVKNCFFVGICTSVHPRDAARLQEKSFAQFNLKRFALYNQLTEAFGKRNRGFLVKREKDVICHIGVFPMRNRENYVEKFIVPMIHQVERKCGIRVCVGLGNPVITTAELTETYRLSRTIGELWPFEQKQILLPSDRKNITPVSFAKYQEEIDQLFRSIVSENPDWSDKLDWILGRIYEFHYGNWEAVRMRIMNFTGSLASKLKEHGLLNQNFYEMQDALQNDVKACIDWSDMKALIKRHLEGLIGDIYESDKSKDKLVILKVKDYVKVHFTEDLSIRELADVACVSPNYFSAMFKKETGSNYKNYLTRIRMEHAIKLLHSTDMKTYEICEEVGYHNVRRFVDVFRQLYDLTPMEYKKQLKGL